jgi:acetylglutamate/LysW-gamma-L-alpha-aminoadipate kinase
MAGGGVHPSPTRGARHRGGVLGNTASRRAPRDARGEGGGHGVRPYETCVKSGRLPPPLRVAEPVDGGVAVGRRKPVIRGTEDGKTRVFRDDHAGTIEKVDPTLIRTLMDAGYVVLISPPALAEGGIPINVDGDKLALVLAEALGADGLLFFSDTPGLLAERHDETSLIREIDASDPEGALAAAQGRMVVKVEQAIKAVERGVGKVVFADARVEQPVTKALDGAGTVVRAAVPQP